ncbi:MAG: glycosyltransferase family 4 protein [Aggregatilineales bacterium]
MVANRLNQLLEEQRSTSGSNIFGEINLVDNALHEKSQIKRVAIISEAFLPKVDGVSKTAYLILRYLQQTGREALVFAPDIAVENVNETQVIRLPSTGSYLAPETRIALPHPTIARNIADFNPDMVLMLSPALMSVSGMAIARHLNIPIIANYQTDIPGYAHRYGLDFMAGLAWRWLRYIHNGCHLTLIPSQTIADDLKAHGYHRLRLWQRGINLQRFDPAHRNTAMREKLLNGRDPNSLLCVYVGRLAPEKCVDVLVDVAKLPGVSLTIIGDGASREQLEAQFAETDTHFTGYLFGDDLGAAFASSDAFFFTGAQETFGQVVQEAMASGLPAVVTSEGGVKHLVHHGETGFVAAHHPAAFAEAAMWLRDNREGAAKMGITARKIAETRPWSALMTELEGYMQEAYLLNERFKRIYGSTTYHKPVHLPRWRGRQT